MGRLDPLRGAWALRTVALMLAGLAATGVGLHAQTVSVYASGFSTPTALAFDADGNLYVANSGNNTMSKVPPGGGTTQFANGFSSPMGLACDTGNLYVTNYGDGTVSKVPFGGGGSTFASGFSAPVGLAFDAEGNLYVANRNVGTVSKVTSGGGSGTTFASGITNPGALAFDAAGYLYVSSGNTVLRIPSGGGAATPFVTVPDYAQGTASSVDGLVFDTAGNLYLVSRKPGAVTKVTPGGILSTVVSGLQFPAALARDAAGDLYVASDTTGIVSKITLPKPTITSLSPTSGAAAGGTSVVITGTNFIDVSAVKFGSAAATGYTVNSATQITATSPSASAGTVHITVTTADGTSTTSAADQFTFLNAPPSVGNLGGDSVAFTEDGSAVRLDAGSNATVTDTDSADFSGGNVTVSIVTNRVSGEDVLSIRHQGTGANQIGVSGSNVAYAGVTIGTFTGGSGTDNLVVTLNANSTLTNVGALLQNLTYHNSNTGNPSTSARTVAVMVNDGDGGTSTAANVTVTLAAVNDAPSWSGLPTDVTVLEDTLSNFNLSAVTLADPDAGAGSMTLTLTASAGTLSATSGGGITAGGSGTDTLTLTGTLANLNAFLDTAANIGYTGVANASGDNAATVTVKLNDGGNTGTGGAREVTLGTVNVDITAVNDAPTLDVIADPTAILEEAGQQTINLSGISAGAGETQTLDVTAISSNTALIPHPTVTYTSPSATGSLSYTPVANANGSAVITVTVTDGGAATFSRTFTVTVTAVNDAPTLSTIGTLTGATEDTPFTITFATLAAAANEADADGDTLSFRVETVSAGTLTKNGASVVAGTTLLGTGESLVWTPAADANGTLDAFTVTAWDGTVASATAVQVQAAVAAVTDGPTVTGATTAEDTQTASGLVVTKNAADGAEVTHFKITAITGGTLFLNDGTTEIANGGFITIAEGDDGLKFTPALNKNTAAGDSFTFSVQAANDGAGTGLSAGAATATITVTSVNDTPTDLALSANSIRRSAAANATIGTLSTTDVDTGDTFTYTLVSGTGDTDNASFNLSGATLRANNPQALTGGARSVRVRSTDAGGLNCEKVFSITVVDDLRVVGTNADSGPGSLRQAIADLPAGGVISFALPSGSETIAVESQLLIDKSLTIDGRNPAGSGTPITVQVTTPGASPWRVMAIELTSDETVTLQGLVLKGGDVRGQAVPHGGVVASEGGTLNLTEVTLRGGVAVKGGGLYTTSATRAIRGTITGNAVYGGTGAAGGGGLFAITGSPLLLLNCTITGNAAQTDAVFSRGGGVYSEGPASIVNSTITGNSVRGMAPAREGGGVYNQSGLVNVVNSIVAGNQTASGSADDIATAPTGITNTYYSWFGAVSGLIGTQATAPNQTTAYSADQLSALGNYGGTSQTVRVNAGAPAIGHGTFVYEAGGYWFLAADGLYHRLDAYATTVAGEPTGMIDTDQRGIARTSPPTIGAYQVGLNVAGTITGAGGVALSGATVSDGTHAATTDASGSYVLRDVSPGTYTLTPSFSGYSFTPSTRSVVVTTADITGADFVAALVPEDKQSQTITFTPLGNAVVGDVVTLSASASSGLPVTFSLVRGPATLSGSTVTCTGLGVVTVRARQTGNSRYDAATPVEQSFTVGLPTPVVTTPTQVPSPVPGGTATLTVPTTLPGTTYQWQRNGAAVPNATNPTLTLPQVQPPLAGLYTYTASTAGGTTVTSEPVIVGLQTEAKVIGTGAVANTDIRHPNGNVYDQLLLEGTGATFTADANQITRMSYVDLSGDIVQVELSGAGTLSLVMDDASAPAPAANYTQPGVNYVRGHVGIVITGANETTNVSVFSVGRANAVNQSLFRDEVSYDGVANVAFVAIQSTNGKFGGVRTGNVEYFAQTGFTGLYAPGVTFTGPVNIGDIQAHGQAAPVLVVGSAPNVRIAGGSLEQPNGQPVQVGGLSHIEFAEGRTSHAGVLPAQSNHGVLEQDGVDVTDLLVGSH